VIKTRIQQPPPPIAGTSSNRPKLAPPPGIWETTRSVVKTDGWRGLWRGTTPTLYRNVPGVSMYFLTLSKFRQVVGNIQFFRQDKGLTTLGKGGGKVKLTTSGDLLVGSTARTGVGFLLMPFTLMKTLSEVKKPLYLFTPSFHPPEQSY